MKIATAAQTQHWDAYTIENEPIASIDLMERAAATCTTWFREHFPDTKRKVVVFCGPGNNGGDGLVIARLLSQSHYEVTVWMLAISDQLSPDAQTNFARLEKTRSGVVVHSLLEGDPLPELPEDCYLLDAVFGTGLSRPVTGYWAQVLEHLNQRKARRIAIDIPSGLFADEAPRGTYFRAHHTFSFERPKLCFFLPESGAAVGDWTVRSIGLHPDYETEIPDTYQFTTANELRSRLHSRGKFDHKGTFGHALLVAGSLGKIGAAILSARACLRAGCGLVTIHAPKCAYEILQIGFPEAMVHCDSHQYVVSEIDQLQPYRAIGVGPGIGTNALTHHALQGLIRDAQVPLVLDADAINILSRHYDWLQDLPTGSILTPHPGEFRRLAGEASDDFDRLEKLRELAMQHGIYVVLKGGHTAIATPEGQIIFNTTGNPGMGTAGTGDVLTGLITGLLAQGYSSRDAATLGVYLHGLAGDLAAADGQQESIIAGDLIDHLGLAFSEIRKKDKV